MNVNVVGMDCGKAGHGTCGLKYCTKCHGKYRGTICGGNHDA